MAQDFNLKKKNEEKTSNKKTKWYEFKFIYSLKKKVKDKIIII